MRALARFAIAALALALCAVLLPAADADAPQVTLNAANAGPRNLEDLTRQSLARDYGRAWAAMTRALAENRTDLLGDDFIGFALDDLSQRVASQQHNNLRTRILDHGHKVDVVFYSPEGLSVELRDTAQVEIQLLDGDKVVHTENVTSHYIAIMTPTEVRWKVRLLQAVPET